MGTVHAKEASRRPRKQLKPEEDDEKEIHLAGIPAKVQRIHIDGLSRTKDDIVTKQVRPLFSASNFEELVKRAEETRAHMEQLGLFRKVSVFIDTVKGEEARPNGYEVTYTVQETRRVAGGVNTLVGTNDGSVMIQGKLPNMFGRGERLSAEYTYGTKSSTGYAINFVKPFLDHPKISLTVGGYRYSGEYPWSGYKETDRGLSVDYTFPTRVGNHSVRWEGVWRDLSALSGTTSFAVRQQAGHTIKSSLKHIFVRDTRDHHVIPNEGYRLRAEQELAGLGGDVHHIKHELEGQVLYKLFLDSVLQFSLAGGMMKTIKQKDPILVNDRFFLGGPLTLRGFSFKGVGPHQDGDALGADTYWLAGAHLYTPLPFRVGRGGFGDLFRTHFFANAGNLENINFSGDWKQRAERLARDFRWAYGAGIVLNMAGAARLELNYCIPVRTQQGDSTNPGVQFGIGINFL